MRMRTGFCACLPVSGSVAVISNSFRPRRRSTVLLHVPSASAVKMILSGPDVPIEIVAPGIDIPRSVYCVVESSIWVTACAGSVTAIVGGFTKRSSWTVM